jgi:uncharacterized protein (TIGR02266 family)
MANSRLSERASFFAEVDVLSVDEPMPQRLWGENLSEAGMFLQTTRPFHPGDRVTLRFDVAEREVHVRAAEVVWVKPFEAINVGGEMPGIGVRFVSVDPQSRAAIRRFIHVDGHSDVPATPPEAELGEGDWVSLDSLKPLSLPPLGTTPPIEVTASIVEESVTAPPREAENALAGWRFAVADSKAHGERAEPSGPADAVMPPPHLAAQSRDEEAVWSFSSGPHPASRLSMDIHERATEPPAPAPPELALLDTELSALVNGDFLDGKLSVLELPQIEARAGRRRGAETFRLARVAVAAGLLATGGALGVYLGYDGAPAPAPDEKARAVLTLAEGSDAPLPVEMAERGLRPAAAEVPAEPAPVPVQLAEAQSDVAAPAPVPDAKLPRKPPPAEARPVEATLAAQVAEATPPRSGKGGLGIEWGRVTVPLEGGVVTRSFALENPFRVVIDLEGASLPKSREDEVFDKGIARVRYGRPDPVHVRIVVELTGDKAPKDITTLKKRGTLSIAWR